VVEEAPHALRSKRLVWFCAEQSVRLGDGMIRKIETREHVPQT
jgi:hypothetical protein